MTDARQLTAAASRDGSVLTAPEAVTLRALALLGVEAAAVAAAGFRLAEYDRILVHARENRIAADELRWPLVMVVGSAVAVVALGFALRLARRVSAERLCGVATLLCPLLLAPLVSVCFDWRLWRGHDLAFLVFATGTALGLERAVRAAAGPESSALCSYAVACWRGACTRARWLRLLPFAVVIAGAAGYGVYFSHHTLAYHYNGHTSTYDLGIEENIVWQTLHGGGLFASTPIYGTATETHFSRHATFIAFVIAPIYAISQRAETLLILQAVWLGLGAVPLYLLVRRRAGELGGVLLSYAYLLYAPLHGANLYDFHFLTLAPPFVFALLYALETRRRVLSVLFLLLTLSVREDVAMGVGAIGLYLMLSGARPRAGLAIAAIGAAYFALMKLVLMPPEGGKPSFLFFYEGALPPGSKSFVGVLETAVLNPAFFARTLLRADKLAYLLQVLAPLALLPLRRRAALVLLLPAAMLTLAAQINDGRALPTFMISFQYTTHWTSFVFFAAALGIQRLATPRWPEDPWAGARWLAALAAMVFGTLATSYQFGAVLQHNTARAGFDDFSFETDAEDLERRAARRALIAQIPPQAKVSASERELPHLANRRWAYTLRTGILDSDWVLLSHSLPWTRPDDLAPVRQVLRDGSFGVVEIRGPFALLKRGHSTAKNQELQALINARR